MTVDEHHVHMSRVKRHLERAKDAAARIHGLHERTTGTAPLSTAGSPSSPQTRPEASGAAAVTRSTR